MECTLLGRIVKKQCSLCGRIVNWCISYSEGCNLVTHIISPEPIPQQAVYTKVIRFIFFIPNVLQTSVEILYPAIIFKNPRLQFSFRTSSFNKVNVGMPPIAPWSTLILPFMFHQMKTNYCSENIKCLNRQHLNLPEVWSNLYWQKPTTKPGCTSCYT